ncbi:MAG: addiction module antidote protein [Bifidobacterium choerinum]
MSTKQYAAPQWRKEINQYLTHLRASGQREARGMTQIAKDAGVGRESLYTSLSGEGNPSFRTIVKVLQSLGGKLAVVPA